jgi:hypothetical protein
MRNGQGIGHGIPARLDPERTPNGRFAPGNRGGPGRAVDEFAALARELYDQHQLLLEAVKMAKGAKPYEKVDAQTRLKANEFVCDRAYGKPRQSFEVEGTDYVIKRVIGVCDDDV